MSLGASPILNRTCWPRPDSRWIPAECVVVEDAPAGIQAGKRAGMRVIAIAFTYPRDQLESSAADVMVDRLSDLTVRRSDNGRIHIRVANRIVEALYEDQETLPCETPIDVRSLCM